MATTLVAVADSPFPSLDPARQALSGLDAEVRLAAEPTPESILEVARDADGLLVTYAGITAEIIEGLTRCRAIGRFGIGVDNIDIGAATKAGIVVTYVPDYCIEEVSDHALALLLALVRKIPFSDRIVQAGRWEMPAVVPITRLRGQTLGLVGFGHIPQRVAPKAKAFGLEVITSDPFISEEVPRRAGVELVTFDELLARSDFVSIHAPSTPQTRNLFSAQAFAKMKPGATLINTARGPLVDTGALVRALDAGEIGAAGLDVVPEEPLAPDSPLLGRDNLILTPHTGFYSEEALLELQTKAASDVAAVLRGDTPRYPINLDDLSR